jgi:hypothetical protein
MLHWIANKVGNGTFPFPKYYQVGREGGREGGGRGGAVWGRDKRTLRLSIAPS